MNVRLLLPTLLFLLIITTAGELYAKPVVKGYSIDDTGKNTSLALDISEETDFKVFTLNNPDRIVVDIHNAVWGGNARDEDRKSSIVGQIRHGNPDSNTLRLVADLNKRVNILDSFFDANTKNGGEKLIVIFGDTKKALYKRQKTDKNLPSSLSKSYKQKEQFASPLKIQNYHKGAVVLSKPASVDYKPVIVIDAGHGGIDPGALGRSGVREKNITLQYAKELSNELQKSGKYRVFLTRKNDSFIKLNERVKKARAAKGDLFISLHADSHPDPNTTGLSVYTISSSRAAREAEKLAKKADKEDVLMGVNLKYHSDDVQQMMINLTQRETTNNSSEFAGILVKELGNNAKLLEKTHRHAGFAVLTGADVPSVLLELGYLSNRGEEKLLKTYAYRKEISSGIKKAIDEYFVKNPPQ